MHLRLSIFISVLFILLFVVVDCLFRWYNREFVVIICFLRIEQPPTPFVCMTDEIMARGGTASGANCKIKQCMKLKKEKTIILLINSFYCISWEIFPFLSLIKWMSTNHELTKNQWIHKSINQSINLHDAINIPSNVNPISNQSKIQPLIHTWHIFLSSSIRGKTGPHWAQHPK